MTNIQTQVNTKCVNLIWLFKGIGIKLSDKDEKAIADMKNFGSILLYASLPNLNECTFLPCSELPMMDLIGKYDELCYKLKEL